MKIEIDKLDIECMKIGGAPVVKIQPVDDDTLLFMTAVIVKRKDAGKAWKKLGNVDKNNKTC